MDRLFHRIKYEYKMAMLRFMPFLPHEKDRNFITAREVTTIASR